MKIWKEAHRENNSVAVYMLIGFQSKTMDYVIRISVHFLKKISITQICENVQKLDKVDMLCIYISG